MSHAVFNAEDVLHACQKWKEAYDNRLSERRLKLIEKYSRFLGIKLPESWAVYRAKNAKMGIHWAGSIWDNIDNDTVDEIESLALKALYSKNEVYLNSNEVYLLADLGK